MEVDVNVCSHNYACNRQRLRIRLSICNGSWYLGSQFPQKCFDFGAKTRGLDGARGYIPRRKLVARESI